MAELRDERGRRLYAPLCQRRLEVSDDLIAVVGIGGSPRHDLVHERTRSWQLAGGLHPSPRGRGQRRKQLGDPLV